MYTLFRSFFDMRRESAVSPSESDAFRAPTLPLRGSAPLVRRTYGIHIRSRSSRSFRPFFTSRG